MSQNDKDYWGYLVLTIELFFIVNISQNFQRQIRMLFMKCAMTRA